MIVNDTISVMVSWYVNDTISVMVSQVPKAAVDQFNQQQAQLH